MNAPISADHGANFSLETVVQELHAERAYLREGRAARTLIRTSDLRIVVVAIKSDKTISEHHANVTASVQTLSGRVRLKLPDRSVELAEGNLLVLGPGLAHDVHAEEESVFLLTLGWPAKPVAAS